MIELVETKCNSEKHLVNKIHPNQAHKPRVVVSFLNRHNAPKAIQKGVKGEKSGRSSIFFLGNFESHTFSELDDFPIREEASKHGHLHSWGINNNQEKTLEFDRDPYKISTWTVTHTYMTKQCHVARR